MKKQLCLLVFMLALAVAYAATQTNPSSSTTQPSGQVKPQNPEGSAQQPPAGAQTGTASQAAASPQDAQSQIQQALNNDPDLRRDNIMVSMSGGDLVLTGDVASEKDRDAAKKIAEKYAGSLRVKDHLKVGGGASDNTLGSAAGNTNGGSELQAGASSGELQTQIHNALRNEPTLSGDNVSVKVSEDEIDVSGAVATAKEKLTAKRIVQSYAGNRKVKDELTLRGHAQQASSPKTFH